MNEISFIIKLQKKNFKIIFTVNKWNNFITA